MYIYIYICIYIYKLLEQTFSHIKAIKSINILTAKFNNKKLPLPAARGPCSSGVRASGPFGPWLRRHWTYVAIPLVVELVLSASYILPPSSSPASFVLVFLLIFFLAFSLRLPFLTVILLLECVRSTSFVWFPT